MTPLQLLDDVKARFPVLLHDEEKALLSLLRKSLAKYQELAGFTKRCRIKLSDVDENFSCAIPPLFSARLALKDANGRFVACERWDDRLELKLKGHEEFPLTLQYLENVVSADLDKYELPSTCISLLGDYLELLITIPNSERKRQVALAGKLDASDIPVETDLAMRRTDLEAQMRLNRAIVPPLSFI